MALIVGANSTTTPGGIGNSGTPYYVNGPGGTTGGYKNASNATLTSIFINISEWDSVTGLKINMCDASGTSLRIVEFTPADGTGPISKPIASYDYTANEGIYFALYITGGTFLQSYRQDSAFNSKQATGSYGTPGNINPAGDADISPHEFYVYADGTTGGGTVNTETLTDTITASDSAAQFAIRGNVSTDNITLADAFFRWWYRTRVMTDNLIITEGATETSTVSNVHAIDEITVSDGIVAWLRRTRLAQDAIAITDEAIASTIGYLIFVSVLTSQLTITDQALTTRYFSRLLESGVLTSDQALRALLVTRNLLDTIDVDDQGLTALQRFILLTDAISLDDSLASVVVTPTVPGVTNPRILIGFDQPRIELGGYGF